MRNGFQNVKILLGFCPVFGLIDLGLLHSGTLAWEVRNHMFMQFKEHEMKLKVVIYEAEEGGYWAEVPALPGCASQGETIDELMSNVHEAIDGWLASDPAPAAGIPHLQIREIAV